MKSRNFTITLLLLHYFVYGQSPILPYTKLQFENFFPLWSHITIDSSIIDNIKYDGRNHIFPLHNKLEAIEKGGFVYTVDMAGLYGIEGGILQKRNLKTGDLIWKNVFDRRIFEYHEWPQKLWISQDGTINVLSFKSIDSYPATDLIFTLLQVPVTWSIRKYNSETGKLINHIFIRNSSFAFNSNEISNFLFECDKGYIYMKRSITEVEEYYSIHKFDTNFNHVKSDTTWLNLPMELNDILIGGVLPYDGGYVSFDVKAGVKKLRSYSLLFWDKAFNVTDSVKSIVLEDLFSDNPSRYFLRYANSEIVLLETMKFDGNEFVPTGYVLNHKGDLIQKFNLPQKNGYYKRSYFTTFSKKQKCPYIITRHAEDGYGIEIYNVCDSLTYNIKAKTFPENIAVTPINAKILSSGDIILSIQQAKDTILNGRRNLYNQGLIWLVLDGHDLGLVSSTIQQAKSNQLSISPNPTHGIIRMNNLKSPVSVKIYNLNGQILKSFTNIENEIDIRDVPAGMYIFDISNKTINERHKIIIIE